jgi:hypothetical protein
MTYTVYQAAEKLGVKPKVIYYAIATNKIKPKKFANVYQITESQLQKLQK